MTDYAVQVRGLRRVYAPRRAEPRVSLDGIDLDVQLGEVHGLLGPNGAGKTTLVKILSTVLLPTEGSATILGRDVVRDRNEVRSMVGCVFGGERGLYSRVSARRNLLFWASLYGLTGREARMRGQELMERVGLADRADEPVENLSRGMMQRVHLARGLIGDPKVILLDEPTTGLDPVAALDFRSLIREMVSDGRSVLLTTHDLDEAEALCTRVSMIDRGKLLMSAAVRDIGAKLAAADRVDFRTEDTTVVEKVRVHPGVVDVVPLDVPGSFRAQPASEQEVGSVIRLLVDAGVVSISTTPPSLEEVYLHVIGDRGMAL